jgi:hypothetical protein
MPWLAATLILALSLQEANATWKANSTTDPLTKEKRPYMSSAGQGAIRQFQRTVSSQLIIHCAYPPKQGVPYLSPEQGVPYLSVDLWFSERVLIGHVKARFRFDTGLVHEREIGGDSGNQFPLLVGLESDESKTSL